MNMVKIYEKYNNSVYDYDQNSRMFRDRILYLFGVVDDDKAYCLIQQLQYLEALDPDADISLYINSPGGSVTAGLAIYDCMQTIKPDVKTYCIGQAASMGAFLLCCGAKDKRYVYPNAEVLIHQPLGGAQGQASDLQIAAKHILKTKERLNKIMAGNTGKSLKTIAEDTDRDNWMTADEAVKYGLVDKVIKPQG